MQEQITTDEGEELRVTSPSPQAVFKKISSHTLKFSASTLEANLVAPTVGVVNSYSGGRGESPFIPVIFPSHRDDDDLQTIVLYVL